MTALFSRKIGVELRRGITVFLANTFLCTKFTLTLTIAL